jgi:hypothetical protein
LLLQNASSGQRVSAVLRRDRFVPKALAVYAEITAIRITRTGRTEKQRCRERQRRKITRAVEIEGTKEIAAIRQRMKDIGTIRLSASFL